MKLAVGLSGGVDSSVAALLALEQGHEVIGLFMKNWEEEDPSAACSAEKDYEDALLVAQTLKIPLYTVNFVEEYRARVFADLLEGLQQGLTPNPDILCNREIKFDLFFKKAMRFGVDAIATGHYAQVIDGRLARGIDPNKDQSYFLYTLQKEVLKKVLFPVGHLHKPQVRELAKKAGLPTADKKDSVGICFVGKRDFKSFVSSYIPARPGPIFKEDGEQIGTHDGAAFYTIGQRHGLCIGGQKDCDEGAWFVKEKDIATNTITVTQDESHLNCFELTADTLSFVDHLPPSRCTTKVRYRSPDAPCVVTVKDALHVQFQSAQRAVTCGQSVVLYDGIFCLGGGIIKETYANVSACETSSLSALALSS